MSILVLVAALHSNPAFATAEQDCGALVGMMGIKPVDTSAFKGFCTKIWTECYKIEDQAAELCGAQGRMSKDADETSKQATGAVGKGKGSFVASGSLARANCDSVKRIRDVQKEGCQKQGQRCQAVEQTFTGKESPAAKLGCERFGPENGKWSAAAKSRNICRTISNELTQLQSVAGEESRSCGGIASTIKETSQSPGENDVKPSEAAAKQNEYAPGPRPSADPNRIEMPYPDARACGIFGCRLNENGSYSPIKR